MTQHVNEVHLIGRLGNSVDDRELPSGVVLTNFSIILDRVARDVHGRTKVDTIACHTSRSSISGRLARLEPGQLIEVSGSIRRRFWRSPGGVGSATEIEVRQLSLARKIA